MDADFNTCAYISRSTEEEEELEEDEQSLQEAMQPQYLLNGDIAQS